EVLDPEQNKSFVDHYLDVPFDLSNTFFIATANVADTIPPPLRDRMEIIELTGYTTIEKLNIANRYLIPKQLREHGLSASQVHLAEDSIIELVNHYTREAGVRELQREIAGLLRACAEEIVLGNDGEGQPVNRGLIESDLIEVTAGRVREILGPQKYHNEFPERSIRPGVATGLAWTPHGGDILFIEAAVMPGTGKLTLTGQLGDVMKESAQIAMSFVRSQAELLAPDFQFDRQDVHIHVPSGAIPKDGPSAGITMLSALASLLLARSVDARLAMTGEITLRGTVLPVGGIKEKILAAHRAGINTVLVPSRNEQDVSQVPEDVRSKIAIVYVEGVEDVLQHSLNLPRELFRRHTERPAALPAA
ncbi:MAG: peptidase, partial [Deltaproteobacteria bacterium]|nr:peptidase [Deltaproteobacteria bacterium]